MKTPIRLFHCLLPFLIATLCATSGLAETYYVDSAGGIDSNNGTSTSTPWQTLTKVNATTFAPGDSILFKAGGSWTGSLNPKGSGNAANPIVIDMYNTGAKPIINGNGVNGTGTTGGGAVYLFNQEYWEINNLEVINDGASDAERRGIHIAAANFGTVDHIHIKNCYIHNIRRLVSSADGDLTAKRTGGIIVEVISDSTTATRFNDVLIEGNTITTVRNEGIVAANNRIAANNFPGTSAWLARKVTNLIIRGNSISDVSKNAMIIRLADSSCLVENNVCFNTATLDTGNTMFTAACDGVVFQFNDGYNNNAGPLGDHDGSLYDADLRSINIKFQYSYSHDNTHGLFWQYPSASGANANIICRYNISRADRGVIFAFSGDAGASSTSHIYNNTIYTPANLSPIFFDGRTSAVNTYYVSNNIFYNLSTTASFSFDTSDVGSFGYNVWYGNRPSGTPLAATDLTSDPLLVSPGSGGNGIGSVTGYQLQSGSPAIDSGTTISGNGGRDYFGNTVPFNITADRGAHEFSGSSQVAAPTFNPPASTYASAQAVTISTTTSGASMRYTVDGSTPTSTTGTLYSSPVSISATTTLKAIAYKSGMTDSTVTTGTYTITVCNPPAITGNPANATACAGSTAGFSVTATGDGLTYQWQINSGGGFGNISGATSSSYTTPATVAGDNGNQYRCVVNGMCGTATSTAATLTVNARPTSVASGSATICSGGSTTIQAALTGTGPWNITWSDSFTQNGVAASPATRSVSPGSTTTYTVTALTDANCTAQAGDRTGSAAVTVNTAPAITTQPQGQTVSAGANVTFTVTATGTAPLTYQWRKGGANISGATSSSYSITSTTTNDSGSYDVVVANSCGSVTSTTATLTVNPAGGLPCAVADNGHWRRGHRRQRDRERRHIHRQRLRHGPDQHHGSVPLRLSNDERRRLDHRAAFEPERNDHRLARGRDGAGIHGGEFQVRRSGASRFGQQQHARVAPQQHGRKHLQHVRGFAHAAELLAARHAHRQFLPDAALHGRHKLEFTEHEHRHDGH